MKSRTIKLICITVTLVLLCASVLCGCNTHKDVDNPVGKLSEDGTYYTNVILLYGQSNATGCAQWKYLQTTDMDNYERYLQGFPMCQTSFVCESHHANGVFEATRFGMGASESHFGPEFGIADVFNSQFSDRKTYIIKWTYGGSNLNSQWLTNITSKRGGFYDKAMEFTLQQLQLLRDAGLSPRIIGVCWMQGESDCCPGDRDKYYDNETKFINYLRNDLTEYYVGTLNFVDAFISTKTVWQLPEVVNSAKQRIADEDSHVAVIHTNGEDATALDLFVNAEPTDNPDLAHYDSASMIALGHAFAQELIALAEL